MPSWSHLAPKNGRHTDNVTKNLKSKSVTVESSERSYGPWKTCLRALEDLKEQERTMYELDSRKDHAMTVLKVALANLAMWTRDRYFPASMPRLPGDVCCRFFSSPARLRRTPHTFRLSSDRSTTACSIETWRCFANG